MSYKAETKIQKFGTNGMTIHIPADVRKDSRNPLRVGDTVIVSVDGTKLTVMPVSAAKRETGAMDDEHTWSDP